MAQLYRSAPCSSARILPRPVICPSSKGSFTLCCRASSSHERTCSTNVLVVRRSSHLATAYKSASAELLSPSAFPTLPSSFHNPKFACRQFATTSIRSSKKITGFEGVKERTEVSKEDYDHLSDDYLDQVLQVMEDLQEERDDVDVEFSAGLLKVAFPPLGIYVINKQPPNKQIWLSSPVSGPKRYDYVAIGEDKKSGEWIYLRDGTTMTGLLEEELGVSIAKAEN